jgi:hypothetical protein
MARKVCRVRTIVSQGQQIAKFTNLQRLICSKRIIKDVWTGTKKYSATTRHRGVSFNHACLRIQNNLLGMVACTHSPNYLGGEEGGSTEPSICEEATIRSFCLIRKSKSQ